MPLDADYLVDRRRLRRGLSVWRALAFVLAAVALIVIGVLVAGPDSVRSSAPQIARVTVEGLIVEDRDRAKMLSRIADSDAVKALIVYINSPGGTTTASEDLYNSIRAVAAKKPVVTMMGTTAASGGYITALAGDHVVAHRTSLTGSIGVLFQWPNVTGLMDNIGVEMNTIKSAPLKAEPNPFTDTSDEARQALRSVIMDSYDWFLGLVMERRDMDEATARRVGDGRVYTGAQALDLGLVDEVGDEEAARAWLRSARGVDPDLKVRDWEVDRGFSEFGFSAASGLARLVGLDGVARQLSGGLWANAASLDGVVALWHPQLIEE